MTFLNWCFVVWLAFSAGPMAAPARAALLDPLKNKDLLNAPVTEEVVRVSSARVVLADYELIRHDFPQTQGMPDSEIDAWLIKETGFISKPQAAQTKVNNPIPTGAETRQAQRPRRYQRAHVFEVEGGLIDAKGTGSLYPSQGDHSNGLATLGEVIREFVWEKGVQQVFDHSGQGHKTVGSYAIIDWGFDVKHRDGSTSRAGALLRQAHVRAPVHGEMLTPAQSLRIELLLRKYGITSAGAYFGQLPKDKINLQGTPDGAVIDFGGFLILKAFERPATMFYGTEILLSPTTPDRWTQPREELRIPPEMWGATVSGKFDPKADNPWIWSHELAEALASGRAKPEHAHQHLRNFLGPLEQKLRSQPAPRVQLKLPCKMLFQLQ